MGADFVIVDPSDLKPNKIYKFMTRWLPWIQPVFWKRFRMTLYLSVIFIAVYSFFEGFIQRSDNYKKGFLEVKGY